MARLSTCLAAATLLATASVAPGARLPQPIVEGRLELPEPPAAGNERLVLAGEWAFYAGRLLTPAEVLADDEPPPPTHYAQVPGYWHSSARASGASSAPVPDPLGYGSYLLELRGLGAARSQLGIFLRYACTSYRLFHFNEAGPSSIAPTLASGTVAATAADAVPGHQPRLGAIRATSERQFILIQVSNYHHRGGGLCAPPTLDRLSNLEHRRSLKQIVSAAILGMLAVLALSNLSAYWQQQRERASLWLGVLAAGLLARTLATEAFFELLAGGSSRLLFEWSYKTEYLTLPLTGLALARFYHYSFPSHMGRVLLVYSGWPALTLALFVLLSPLEVYSRYVLVFLIWLTLGIAYIAWRLIAAWRSQAPYAGLATLGSLPVFLAGIYDMAVAVLLLDSIYLTPYSMIVFILAQSLIMAKRYSVALETAQSLTHDLQAAVDQQTSQLRRQTHELTRQAVELRELQEAKDRFFTNVSHELRTPLTLTLGPLEEAERLGTQPAPLAQLIETALRNARQLRNLVDQVLDIHRLEAGAMPLRAASGDLGALVRRTAGYFEDAAARGEVILDLTAVGAGVEAWFDPDHLERVVTNLVSNALKHTPPGGSIHLALRREEEIVLRVRDTGSGIEESDLERIFERFFQTRSTVAERPGTGIGLALVRELAELHGGRVEAASEVGKGSTFTVYLPVGKDHLRSDQLADPRADLTPPAAPIAPVVADAGPRSTGTDPGDATTLLIVDDNAELRGFLRQRFAGSYRVLEAANGAEALALCRQMLPDLVICDVMMPVMDGLEMTRALKADPELDFLPVILLTARAATEDAVSGLGAGADDYLRKPFDAVELDARVERLIDSRRQLRARFAAPEAKSDGLNPSDASFDRKLVSAIEELLEKGTLTVQSLAQAMAMDRTHLYRRVQAVRETSPQELIRRVRLQTAARMLAEVEGTVTEVAYSVGFKSLGHFTDSFRRHFGMTPSAWQRSGGSGGSRPEGSRTG